MIAEDLDVIKKAAQYIAQSYHSSYHLEVDELINEGWIAYNKIGDFSKIRNRKNYIYTCVKNRMLDIIKHIKSCQNHHKRLLDLSFKIKSLHNFS